MTGVVLGLVGEFVVAFAGLLALALKAIAAERRAGESKARADANEVRITSLGAQLADATTQLKDTQERLDALDRLFVTAAAAGPVDGAFSRLLQKWEAERANRDGAPAVHHDETALGPDDLMPIE